LSQHVKNNEINLIIVFIIDIINCSCSCIIKYMHFLSYIKGSDLTKNNNEYVEIPRLLGVNSTWFLANTFYETNTSNIV
jgi:hypothetical protein